MTYSLFELNEYIRQVMALNFSDPIWVKGELSQANFSRGHCYLNLVQKGAQDEILAQSQGVIWALQLKKLRNKLGLELDVVLQEGIEVLLQVKVDFHERYGLKLIVHDIDPAYTLGKLALKRRETILKLKAEGLLEKNKALTLPLVIQRVAILSSETAAGWKDFLNEMTNNEFGYQFKLQLFSVAMQGVKVVEEIISALEQINPADFDVLIVIRGGGSKLDLSAFDEYKLCEKMASVPIPVVCGIGHEIDETVLDKVAHTSLKTPTAVAGFVIHHNMHFESMVLSIGQEIQSDITKTVNEQDQLLKQIQYSLEQRSKGIVHKETMMLDYIQKELPLLFKHEVEKATRHLDMLDKSVAYLSPEMTLKRGYTITTRDGFMVSQKNIGALDELETQFHDGSVKSIVKK